MDYINFAPYILWFISLVFIVVALYVIIMKRPLIINSVWIVIMLFLCFFAQIYSSIEYLIEDPSFIGVIPILAFVGFMIMFFFMMKGYSFYGVNDTDFQDKLIELLNEKNYDYKQGLSTIKIMNQDIETTITIQSWLGVSHLRIKGKGDKALLKSIVGELRKKSFKINYLSPVFYLIIGVLICTMSIFLFLDK